MFFKVLRHLSQQGQDLGPNRTASNYAPSVIAKHPDAKGVRKDELEAAQQRLLDANRIHIDNVGPEFQTSQIPRVLPRPIRPPSKTCSLPPIPPGPGTGAESLEASSPGSGLQAGNLKPLPRYRRIERTPAARARSPSRVKSRKDRPLRRPTRPAPPQCQPDQAENDWKPPPSHCRAGPVILLVERSARPCARRLTSAGNRHSPTPWFSCSRPGTRNPWRHKVSRRLPAGDMARLAMRE